MRQTRILEASDESVAVDARLHLLQEQVERLKQELNVIRNESRAARLETVQQPSVRIILQTRCNLTEAQTECEKYKERLKFALQHADRLRTNSRDLESRCRALDDSLEKARKECKDAKAVEAE